MTLPAAGTAGGQIAVKNSGAGTITIDGNAAELIDGQLTLILGGLEAVTLVDTGTGWVLI